MAIDLSALNRWVDEQSSDLLHRTILDGRLAKHGRIIPGIKYQYKLNILDDNFAFVADTVSGAGFGTGISATTLSQRALTVCSLKTEKQFAINGDNSLSQYWIQFLMKPGAYQENLPWEQKFTAFIEKELQQQVDGALVLGGYVPVGAHSADTAGSFVQGTTACQGLLYNLYNTADSASTITVTYSGAPTPSTIYNILKAMVKATPQDILGRDDITIWCQPSYVTMLKQALIDNNNFGYFVQTPNTNTPDGLSQVMPGFDNIMVRATPGFGLSTNGYQGFILVANEHLCIGTDLGSADLDRGELRLWYSEDYDSYRMRFRTRLGCNVQQPTQVVVY
jgi:hypothetical protein